MSQYITPTLLIPVLVIALILMFFLYYWSARGEKDLASWARQPKTPLTFAIPRHPMGRKDALPLLLITVVYALTAFFQLGSFTSPQSTADFSHGQPVVIELSQTLRLTRFRYFSGLGTGDYDLECSADGRRWLTLWAKKDDEGNVENHYWANAANTVPGYAVPQKYNDLFKWKEIELDNPQDVKYLRITGRTNRTGPLELAELALYDQNGARVTAADPQSPLFDEQDTVPEKISWYNSAYFDEIYHARTALEHVEGVYPYEVSHPPLGKLILSIGIQIFGMTPFGWRFMGTLLGVLMLPILYVFLKNLFGRTVIAACGTIFFAFDFMHLTQTRIATIDTYGVFFILLMYYFMYRYLTLPAGSSFRKGALPLLLSGLCWGLGAASKWTVIYGGIGLAVLYFIGLYFKWRDWPRGGEADPRAPSFAPWLVKTLLFSVLCFVLLPMVIYVLSYLPYAQAKGVDLSLAATLDGAARSLPVFFSNLWGRLTGPETFHALPIPTDTLPGIVAENQWFMFTYHSGVTDFHPYASRWYQWIVDGRPILYYLDNSQVAVTGLKAAFGCFNNPIVAWAGLFAIVTTGVELFRKKSGIALFILVGYFSQLAPWFLIGRTIFEYHYFPSTLFLVLALAYVCNELILCRPQNWKGPVYALTAGTVAAYAMFYPVLVGLMVPTWYTTNLLQWLPSWPF